jgi:iron(III) transport system ATP-binding protein
MTALTIAHVTHQFGRRLALDDVTLSVADGEIQCLLGPSGCGKSTLLRIAAGLEPLQSGSVSIADRLVARFGEAEMPPEQRGIGFLFQDFALFPHLTALDNAAFGLEGLAKEARRERALAALAQVGVADLADAYPHTLSGGQQQRVALARALAPAPRLFLLDEPFSGIDARLRRRLIEDTWRILKQSGAASVVVTHDPEEAMLLGDRVAVMRAGRILQCDTADSIYRRPVSAFVAEILSEVNRFRGTVDARGWIETPLGPVASEGLAPGARAVVIVRQSGIALLSNSQGEAGAGAVPVRVNWARPMGATSLVQLQRRDPGAPHAAFYARVPGPRPDHPANSAVARPDPNEVFVFASENSADGG